MSSATNVTFVKIQEAEIISCEPEPSSLKSFATVTSSTEVLDLHFIIFSLFPHASKNAFFSRVLLTNENFHKKSGINCKK